MEKQKVKHLKDMIRNLFFYLLLVLPMGLKAQGSALKIKTTVCNKPIHQLYSTTLKVYKEDQLLWELRSSSSFLLDSLKPGNYVLEYNTILNYPERRSIKIEANQTYEEVLCLDQYDYQKIKHQPVIDRLKIGESFRIEISSRGCFHSNQDTIVFFRNANGHHVKWGKNSKTLNAGEMELIRKFEKELSVVNGGGCTTETDYKLKYGGQTIIKAHDETCEWDGEYSLERKLFPSKVEDE